MLVSLEISIHDKTSALADHRPWFVSYGKKIYICHSNTLKNTWSVTTKKGEGLYPARASNANFMVRSSKKSTGMVNGSNLHMRGDF